MFLIVAVISFFVIKELIFAVLYSIVLAFFFYPLYNKIKSLIKYESVSAIIVIFIIIFIVTIPLVFISNELIKESLNFYSSISKWQLDLAPFLREGIQNVLLSFSNTASDFLFSLPARLLNIFVSLFLLFYFFIDGKKIVNNLKEILPLNNKRSELFFNDFKQVSYGVVYGLILTGIIVGVLSGLGFYIFDAKSPILLSFLVMIFVILPIVGSFLVWGPVALLKIMNGDMINGIGLAIYGLVVLSMVELILKPKLMSKKAKIHPILTVLGVIGGLKFFGFIGIIFGPFILALFLTMLRYLVIKR
jgi:predicted PurR-regulated permease PerM